MIHQHSLRHTSATLLLSGRAAPEIVQERLGHQSISITLDTYAHALPRSRWTAPIALDGLLCGAASQPVVKPATTGALFGPWTSRNPKAIVVGFGVRGGT